MTVQELNIAIVEGTKKFGNRNAYLASPEYAALYKTLEPVKKSAKKVEIVFVEWANAYMIKVGMFGKNPSYEATLGNSIGIGSGPVSFKTVELAKEYCSKRKYTF